MEDQINTIYIGSDHAGYLLKTHLVQYVTTKYSQYKIIDLGTSTNEKPVDYPNYSFLVGQSVSKSQKTSLGLLICGSGIGISIAANKCKGAKACLCWETKMAESARQMGVNIISMGERVCGKQYAEQIVDAFLQAKSGSDQEFEKYAQKFDQKYLAK